MTDSLKLPLHLATLLTWIDLRILVVHNGRSALKKRGGYSVYSLDLVLVMKGVRGT